ncbi:MAG: hypothetical protein WCO75_05805 [Planctomycetota bacterium]
MTIRFAPVFVTSVCVLSLIGTASAGVVTEWTFDSHDYEATSGTGRADLYGTTLLGWQTGSTGNTTDGALRMTGFATAKAKVNAMRGMGLSTSTEGWETNELSWMQRVDARASALGQLQYAVQGGDFSSVGLVNGGRFQIGTVGQYQRVTFDLSGIAEVTDSSNIEFRIVAVKDASGKRFVTTSGRKYQAKAAWTVDQVVLGGVEMPNAALPAPGVLALAALTGGLGGRMGRRRDRMS